MSKTPKERFWEICSDLVIKVDARQYPNSIFYFKGDEYYFEITKKRFYLYFHRKRVLQVFQDEFPLSYNEIENLIKNEWEEHLKIKLGGLRSTTGLSVFITEQILNNTKIKSIL